MSGASKQAPSLPTYRPYDRARHMTPLSTTHAHAHAHPHAHKRLAPMRWAQGIVHPHPPPATATMGGSSLTRGEESIVHSCRSGCVCVRAHTHSLLCCHAVLPVLSVSADPTPDSDWAASSHEPESQPAHVEQLAHSTHVMSNRSSEHIAPSPHELAIHAPLAPYPQGSALQASSRWERCQLRSPCSLA